MNRLPPVNNKNWDSEVDYEFDLTDKVNGKPVKVYPYWIDRKFWKAPPPQETLEWWEIDEDDE